MDQAILSTGNINRGDAALNEDPTASFASAERTTRRCTGDQYLGNKVHLASDALLLPGLGCTSVSKNGMPVLELHGLAGEYAVTVGDAERLALAGPEAE